MSDARQFSVCIYLLNPRRRRLSLICANARFGICLLYTSDAADD